MLKKYKKIPLALTFIFAILISSYSPAHALRIIPSRLVLGPDVKVEYMFIKNNSDKQQTFRFGWKHLAMDKEGNILNLEKIGMDKAPEGYNPLDDIIRFSPRRTIIKPGQVQRVTFMINRSKALKAGEYRSHFLVQREPNKPKKIEVLPKETNVESTDENAPSTPQIQVDILVSRAVPIYVLHGETNAKLNFLKAEIKKNAGKTEKYHTDHFAHFRVQKIGNRSIIGVAQILCNSGGKEVVISKPSKIFVVYAEGEYRNETIAVKIPPKGCSSYRLHVKGHSDDVLAGKTLLDQKF